MPDADGLRLLLEAVRTGELTIEQALERIGSIAVGDLGFAQVDHARARRCGFPEVIFCQQKSAAQVLAIAREILRHSDRLLATRIEEATARTVLEAIPDAVYDPVSRTVTVSRAPARSPVGRIAIVAAGTSDLPVAEEARVTATIMGARVETFYDVGVAGLHRLGRHIDAVRQARVVVAVAGMEGALPSVVGGLVDRPVIAVPTSVGYGTSFQGLAALLGMLNSCASGVTVVNIDNGFGAGYAAALINRDQ
ncbi:MAG: nickel pincer cofactor biosynthesis protein LarB [Planctomycetota bacterium]